MFQKVESEGGLPALYVSRLNINHVDSMAALAENGLRPLTYQEALSRSDELLKLFKGRWFYLAGDGLLAQDKIYAFNERGKLMDLCGSESIDQVVRIYPGTMPPSFTINNDHPRSEFRFEINADVRVDIAAPLVLGLRIELPTDLSPRLEELARSA